MANTRELLQFPEKLVLELCILIMIDSRWVSKAGDEIIVDFFSGCVG